MNKSRLILIGLVISIALNMVFIGGISYRASNYRGQAPRPLPPNLSWAIRDLSEERQSELEPLISARSEDVQPIRAAMFAAMRRVNELMRAEDFDSEALSAAFAQLREASDSYQVVSHEQTVAVLAELTDEERRTAQEFMQRRGPRGDRDGRRDRRDGPGFRPGGRPPPGGPDGGPPPLPPR